MYREHHELMDIHDLEVRIQMKQFIGKFVINYEIVQQLDDLL